MASVKAVSYLRVCKWGEYQHYRDRRPVWIKFHTRLLRSEPMSRLPVSTRFLWTQLLLLAAEYDNAIPNDPELIAKLLRMSRGDVREGIRALLKGAWLRETRTSRRASKTASPEKEVEKEKEKTFVVKKGLEQDVPAGLFEVSANLSRLRELSGRIGKAV